MRMEHLRKMQLFFYVTNDNAKTIKASVKRGKGERRNIQVFRQ